MENDKEINLLKKRIKELEIKKAENVSLKHRLEQATSNWQSTFDSVTDIVMLLSLKHEILDINKAGCIALKKNRDEIIGKKCFEVAHGQDAPIAICPCAYVIETGKIGNICEYEENDRVYELSAWPTVDENGKIKSIIHIVKDITERKRIENELRESEEKYRNLFEAANDAIFLADADTGIILAANKKTEELTGIPGEEIVGIHQSQLHPKEEVKFHKQKFKEAVQNGSIIAEDVFVCHRDGHKIPVDISTNVLKLGDKRIIQGIFRDVTERKKSEEALRKAEEKYRSIYENAVEGIYQTTPDSKFISANPALAKMLGYKSPEELIEEVINIEEQMYVDSKQRQEFKKLIAKQSIIKNYEIQLYRKDRQKIWVLSTSRAVRDNKGRIKFYEGIIVDITERKLIQDELQKNEEKYRKFFEDDITGDFITTPQGKILFCNPAFANILGYKSVEDVLKSTYNPFYLKKAERKKFLQLITDKKRLDLYESELIRKDGKKIIIIENVIGIFDDNGKLIQIKGYLIDITERKKAELEVLNSREKLRNLSSHLQSIREEERGNIAREIHDDLGQSLTALKMDMSWLEKHLHEGKDRSGEKIKGMKNLVDETIKSVQRISSELRPGVLDDIGFSAAVKWFMNEFEKRSGLKCQLDIKPDEIVLEDKLSISMYRIFQESLTNIARHAKATEVKVSLNLIKDNLELIVKDNGVGIDEEKLQDPKSIGLIGMQERVYPWHGTVEINGEKGNGTVVHVNVKC